MSPTFMLIGLFILGLVVFLAGYKLSKMVNYDELLERDFHPTDREFIKRSFLDKFRMIPALMMVLGALWMVGVFVLICAMAL